MPISSLDRYSRQVLFGGIGAEGQQRLANSRVVLVGCGATGSATAWTAGARRRGLSPADRPRLRRAQQPAAADIVRRSRRRRIPAQGGCRSSKDCGVQFGYQRRIARVRPRARIPWNPCFLQQTLILDGTDNFETRYLVNDFAVKNSVPWIYAAAVGSYAVTMNVLPGRRSLPGVHLSRSAPRDGGNLRHRRNFEFSRQLGGVRAGDRSHQAAGRRAEKPCGDPCFPLTCGATILRKSPHACRIRSAGRVRSMIHSSCGRRTAPDHAVRAEFRADPRAPPSRGLCRNEPASGATWHWFATTTSS